MASYRIWEVWASHDETELSLCKQTERPVGELDYLRKDLDGRPMKLLKRFRARSFVQATAKRNKLLGWKK